MDPEDTRALLAPTPEYLATIKVFPLIPHLKKDVIKTIDSALSWEQLTASDINFAIVRPFVFRYANLHNIAAVYAALVVRSHFLSQAGEDLAYSGVMLSRANFCEILAMKLLGHFASQEIQLVAVLTTSWNPLAGAPEAVVKEVKRTIYGTNDGDADDEEDPQSALEVAVRTKAKSFLASPIVQKVVNDIYSGRVVFSTQGTKSVLADNYKPRAIEIYDSHRGPFINHYRLRVPRYHAILDFLGFAVLLLTFLLCLSTRDLQKVTFWEAVFLIFAVSFCLEEYTASKEHGWIVYIANMWNAFDTFFVLVFLAYLGLRIHGLTHNDAGASELGFDILACGACILFPRLAFFAVSNNVVVLALRAMIAEFFYFILIAAICFSGLLFTLSTLAGDRWTVKAIAWLMVQIWFGNTYLSFGQATSFHPVFGPILMTMFAALSNTLLLTILISILSNTFATIDANANQEYLYQFTISTIEGVKSDALFSYQPPFNLLALLLLKPASYIVSPRRLHSWNVFLIKLTSLPILIAIGIYERHLTSGQHLRMKGRRAAHSIYSSLPKQIKNMPFFEAIVGSDAMDLYDAILEVDVSDDLILFEDSEEEDVPLLSAKSHENLRQHRSHEDLTLDPTRDPREPERSTTRRRHRPSSASRSPARSPLSEGPSVPGTPRSRKISSLQPLVEPPSPTTEVMPSASTDPSPLSRLFSMRSPSKSMRSPAAPGHAHNDAGFRRIEGLLEDIKDLPVRRLKDEMKELQERQARIETLLLTLTRGMRNETTTHSGVSRHDTVA